LGLLAVCTVEGVVRRDQATLTDAEQRAVRLIREIRSQIAAGTISEKLNAPARLAHYVISAYHGYPHIRMSRLASALGVSLRTLEREFRDVFRTSMKAYQIESRLKFAQYLLSSSPNLKVGVIAKQLGYNDPNVFERFFRLQTGVSPHAWRASDEAQRMRQEQK
jgi:AraC-like DNA-binding protein